MAYLRLSAFLLYVEQSPPPPLVRGPGDVAPALARSTPRLVERTCVPFLLLVNQKVQLKTKTTT